MGKKSTLVAKHQKNLAGDAKNMKERLWEKINVGGQGS
jgi:hypothetical protein